MQSSKGIDIKKGPLSNSTSNYRRNQSWPPVEVHVTPPSGNVKSLPETEARQQIHNTDEDPWSHFITPAREADFLLDSNNPNQLAWEAGSATPPNQRPALRKTHEQFLKHGLAERWDSFIAKRQELANNPPHRYVDNNTVDGGDDDDDEIFIWPNTVEADLLDRTPSPDPNHLRPTSLTDTYDPYRDQRERRARKKYKRTLSSHRHSWLEPSMDIFPVSETASEYHADDVVSLDDDKPMSRSAVELGQRAKL